MAEEQKQDTKGLGRKAYEWLKELGVPAILAAGIVALLYGLLVYLGVISLSGCTADYSHELRVTNYELEIMRAVGAGE